MDDLVSRRTFLAAAITSASSLLLETVDGGVILPFSVPTAYANTTSEKSSNNTSTTIVLVTKDEIAFAVQELFPDTSKDPAPVDGFSVQITSRYNGKSVTGTTKNGYVVLNIAELSEGYISSSKELNAYEFNATIDAKLDGYREFKTGLMRISGGSGFNVPTRSITSNTDPYAIMMTFDDVDVQYNKTGIPSTSENDIDHSFVVEIEAPAATAGTLELWIDGESSARDTVDLTFDSHRATATFTDKYLLLKDVNTAQLPIGATCYFVGVFGNDKYRFSCELEVFEGAMDHFIDGDCPVSIPPSSGLTSIDLTMPGKGKLPVLGGSSLSVWTPYFPAIINGSPNGSYLLGLTTPNIGFIGDKGITDSSNWKKHDNQSYKKKWAKTKDELSKSIDNYKKGLANTDPNHSKFIQNDFVKQVKCVMGLQYVVWGMYDWESKKDLKWSGGQRGLIKFGFEFEATESFSLVCVPCFITFDFSAAALFALSLTFKAKQPFDFSTYEMDYSTTGLWMSIPVSAALTAGVGFSGLLSIGIRGTACFTVTVTLGPHDDNPLPHVICDAGVGIDLVVQLFFFNWNGSIASWSWPQFYNNWPKSSLTNADEDGAIPLTTGYYVPDSADPSSYYTLPSELFHEPLGSTAYLQEFIDGATIITNNQLSAVSELKATVTEIAAGEGLDPRYNYEYCGENTETVCPLLGGVAGLGEEGGVKPTADILIAHNVLSDPRIKLITFNNVTYQFRIIAVQYPNGVARTRLAWQKFDESSGVWSTPNVVDFDTGLSDVRRIDMFDYDFDIDYYDGTETSFSQKRGFFIFMTSGIRPQGDKTTITEAMTNPLAVCLALNEDLSQGECLVGKDILGSTSYEAGYHTYACPRLIAVSAGKGKGSMYHLGYLHRKADTAEALLTNEATVTLETSLYAFGKWYTQFSAKTQVDSGAFNIEFLSTVNTSSSSKNEIPCSIACLSSTNTSVYTYFPYGGTSTEQLITDSELISKLQDYLDVENVEGVQGTIKQNIASAPAIAGLQPNRAGDGWLFCRDGHLYQASYDIFSQSDDFTLTDIGPQSFEINQFATSENGRYLFFAHNKVGNTGTTYDENYNPTSTETNIHGIMAACLIDGRYSKPFVFCDREYPGDQVVAFAVGDSAASFLATNITDAKSGQADIHFVAIPLITCATALDLTPADTFVYAGSKNAFNIAVANNGNTVLTGCTATLYASDGTKVASTPFTFSQEALRKSVSHPEACASRFEVQERLDAGIDLVGRNMESYIKDDGVSTLSLDDETPVVYDGAASNVLLPGDHELYEVTFDIPEKWPIESGQDEHEVEVVLSDFVMSPLDGSFGTESPIVEHVEEVGSTSTYSVTLLDVTSVEDDFGPGTVTKINGGGNGGNNNQRDSVPDTGDSASLGALGLGGLALAGAGAAVLAYCKRRVENEQGSE